MTATQERRAYAYGRDHEFTKEEYDALTDELDAAIDRDDEEAMNRLIKKLPIEADVLMAFASVYGKELIMDIDFDLTQANMKYGEGWLDELKP